MESRMKGAVIKNKKKKQTKTERNRQARDDRLGRVGVEVVVRNDSILDLF